ncbi:hypothetical protein FB451DRAFT_1161680 [Mycena latifolia]|nr:hypothetical protein FB451DRAFT_1161680 [Mycena latifolia]
MSDDADSKYPPTFPGFDARGLELAIQRARESRLEAPWYRVWGTILSTGPLSVSVINGRQHSIRQNLLIQECLALEPKEDRVWRLKVTPDFATGVAIDSQDPTIEGTAEQLSLIVENKKNRQHHLLYHTFVVVWSQVYTQVHYAFESDSRITTLGSIVTVGPYWSYREWTVESLSQFDTYSPPDDEETDSSQESDFCSEDSDSEIRVEEEALEDFGILLDARNKGEDLDEPMEGDQSSEEGSNGCPGPGENLHNDGGGASEIDPDGISNIDQLEGLIFSVDSPQGKRALEMVRRRGVDLLRHVWYPPVKKEAVNRS